MDTALTLVRRQLEADHVFSFFFRPQQPLAFEAGQFLELSLPHPAPDESGTTRCLTIASAPSEPLLQLTTRIGPAPSTFKHALYDLRPGDAVAASGPYGDFVSPDTGAPIVFIAGGIGITPFRSMLLDLAARPARPAVSLLYSNSSPSIPFRPEFDALERDWPELRLEYTVTRPSPTWSGAAGRIDASFIARHVDDPSRARYFACGPAGFIGAVRQALAFLGVPPSQIKQEDFPGYEAPAEASPVAA
jgi:glycine betaine catabolism B